MKNILLLFISLICINLRAQTSSAKIQWKRTQIGNTSDDEIAIKSYRDPSTGNMYVLYQGSSNFGIAKFDNTGTSTGYHKHIAPYGSLSFVGDFKYVGNDEFIVGFCENYYTTIIRVKLDGTLVWSYRASTSNAIGSNFQKTIYAITIDGNQNTIAAGDNNDYAKIYKVNNSGTLAWETIYQPSGYGKGRINAVKTDSYNNIYACGYITNAAGNIDAFIVCYDENGTILWEHITNGLSNANDWAQSLVIDNSGNTYIGGSIADSSASNNSLFLAKYNASGGQQYFKKFHLPTQTNAQFGNITVDAFSNVYIGGTFTDATNNVFPYIRKYNSLGNVNWTTSNDDVSYINETVVDIKVDLTGATYIAGTCQNIIVGSLDQFVLKINNNGTFLWSKYYNNPNSLNDISNSLILDNGNNCYIIGHNSYTIYGEISNLSINKYSSSGTLLWEGSFNAPGNKNEIPLKVIKDGSYAVYTLGTQQNDISFGDAVLSKYNSKGVLLWQIFYDDNNVDNEALAMVMDPQKNIYILVRGGGYDYATVLKYDSLGSFIWEKKYNKPYRKMVIGANNNLYIAGSSDFLGLDEFNYLSLDANGNTLNSYSTNTGTYNLEVTDIALTNNNELYVLGNQRIFSASKAFIKYSKFDASGNPLWTKTVQGIDSTDLNNTLAGKIVIDTNNNFYITATINDLNLNYPAALVSKLDVSGNVIWNQVYNNNDIRDYGAGNLSLDEYGDLWLSTYRQNFIRLDAQTGAILLNKDLYSLLPYPYFYNYMQGNPIIKRYKKNQVLCAVEIESNAYAVANNTAIIYGMYLVNFDTLGNIIWKQHYVNDNISKAFPYDMALDTLGRIYVLAGSAETEGQLSDITLIKFCDLQVPSVSFSGPTTNICSGNPITLNAQTGTSYLWSPTNSTQQNISTDTTGNYSCLVYQSDGCYQSTDTIQVTRQQPPAAPSICMVTVDSLSTHNIVYWDKPITTGIASFNIYREDVTNVYSYIGTVLYDSLSVFHDYTADPNVTTKRYKISALDSCGQESALSNFHNTLYIVSNGSGQFSWFPIYTIENNPNPVNNYVLMRDDNNTNTWTQIQTTAGTQNTIVDPQFASFPNANWRVETIWGISCNPTLRTSNENETQFVAVRSRSNIKTQRLISLDENKNQINFSIYPNPNNGLFTLNLQNRDNKTALINVKNTLGQTVLTTEVRTGNNTINLGTQDKGVYFISIVGSANVIKVVVQ